MPINRDYFNSNFTQLLNGTFDIRPAWPTRQSGEPNRLWSFEEINAHFASNNSQIFEQMSNEQHQQVVETILSNFLGLPNRRELVNHLARLIEFVGVVYISLEMNQGNSADDQPFYQRRNGNERIFLSMQAFQLYMRASQHTVEQVQPMPSSDLSQMFPITKFHENIRAILASYYSESSINRFEEKLALKDMLELTLYNNVDSYAAEFIKVLKKAFSLRGAGVILLYIDKNRMPAAIFNQVAEKAKQLLENEQERFNFSEISDSYISQTTEHRFDYQFRNQQTANTVIVLRFSNNDSLERDIIRRFSMFRSDLECFFFKNVPNSFRLSAKMIMDRRFRFLSENNSFIVNPSNSTIEQEEQEQYAQTARNIVLYHSEALSNVGVFEPQTNRHPYNRMLGVDRTVSIRIDDLLP